ncbi:MAG TPA: 30S ribosomal protein S4 [Verrucomicrobiae bacterium]|nr:30S ribosomal protein S4 [Verrucomicrobiae bacterium]
MARYKGPRTRISRRFGVPIFGPSKYLERRSYPPGVHGPKKSRRKQSDYGVGLAEKQKLRFQYGLMERQFRRMFEKARKKRGVTGETLLQLLETRLDNVVFRVGFATTRPFARQLVSHGHVHVNGRKVSAPSYNVKPGDIIAVRDTAVTRQLVTKSLESAQIRPVPDWIAFNRDAIRAQVQRMPTRDDIQPIVNEQLIVEFYSR